MSQFWQKAEGGGHGQFGKVNKKVEAAMQEAAASKLAAGYRGMKTRKALMEDPEVAAWLAGHEGWMDHGHGSSSSSVVFPSEERRIASTSDDPAMLWHFAFSRQGGALAPLEHTERATAETNAQHGGVNGAV